MATGGGDSASGVGVPGVRVGYSGVGVALGVGVGVGDTGVALGGTGVGLDTGVVIGAGGNVGAWRGGAAGIIGAGAEDGVGVGVGRPSPFVGVGVAVGVTTGCGVAEAVALGDTDGVGDGVCITTGVDTWVVGSVGALLGRGARVGSACVGGVWGRAAVGAITDVDTAGTGVGAGTFPATTNGSSGVGMDAGAGCATTGGCAGGGALGAPGAGGCASGILGSPGGGGDEGCGALGDACGTPGSASCVAVPGCAGAAGASGAFDSTAGAPEPDADEVWPPGGGVACGVAVATSPPVTAEGEAGCVATPPGAAFPGAIVPPLEGDEPPGRGNDARRVGRRPASATPPARPH